MSSAAVVIGALRVKTGKSHQQLSNIEMGPLFRKTGEKWGIDLVMPELVVQPVVHYTTAGPVRAGNTQIQI